MSSGSALRAIRCQATSLARNNVPDANTIVATRIWSFAAGGSGLTGWGRGREWENDDDAKRDQKQHGEDRFGGHRRLPCKRCLKYQRDHGGGCDGDTVGDG